MPKKELVGKVISNKMEKTVVVAVESLTAHTKYEKPIVQTRKFKAHDPERRCRIGDQVRLRECRPLSKEKRWLVIDVARSGEDLIPIAEVDSL